MLKTKATRSRYLIWKKCSCKHGRKHIDPKTTRVCQKCGGKGHFLNPALIPVVISVRNTLPRFLGPNFVYIGRATGEWPQSIWANNYRMRNHTRAERANVMHRYEIWIPTQPALMEAIPTLIATEIGCWCAPDPCHGDILRKLVIEHLLTLTDKYIWITHKGPRLEG